MQYRCIKDFTMQDKTRAFTKGKVYQGESGASISGQRMISFTDDQGEGHLMSYRNLREYFEVVR